LLNVFPFAMVPHQSYLAIVMRSRDHFEGAPAKPTAAQMVPQGRHFVDQAQIFEAFSEHFEDHAELKRLRGFSLWEGLGAVKYHRNIYVPGSLHSGAPYALNDAMKFCAFALHPSRALGTRAAVLFHHNHGE